MSTKTRLIRTFWACVPFILIAALVKAGHGEEGPWKLEIKELNEGLNLQNDDGSVSSGTLTLVRVLSRGHLYRSHIVGPPDRQDEIETETDFVYGMNYSHQMRFYAETPVMRDTPTNDQGILPKPPCTTYDANGCVDK